MAFCMQPVRVLIILSASLVFRSASARHLSRAVITVASLHQFPRADHPQATLSGFDLDEDGADIRDSADDGTIVDADAVRYKVSVIALTVAGCHLHSP
jgi:hypothetical protein